MSVETYDAKLLLVVGGGQVGDWIWWCSARERLGLAVVSRPRGKAGCLLGGPFIGNASRLLSLASVHAFWESEIDWIGIAARGTGRGPRRHFSFYSG